MKDKKICALIVDNDQEFLEICMDFFITEDFEVFSASNCVDALEINKSEDIDIHIINLNMPTAEDSKKYFNTIQPALLEGKAIFYFMASEFDINLIMPGVTSVLVKPFDIDDVVTQIKGDVKMTLLNKIR